ncbi:heavy metal sensor signal transduction histidine kinase [Thioalkalivibrio sulfidiphilus HL-EbGr7]|uniref:Sensor protein n=1 Tax=Thioalkalivibrio sulfidiphilus (strain HL-EbGR7) TaxID=396588 RepID=B8GQA0_THISH|nr:heavy metal sensor histidine kinase [Thioalkalivibrio sulfidiphilus]ACL72295.1 heavy metal sensor signal transduction histidine kinase [Thioalkalivibrio sulfidiphilus HL-EbGr7]
MSHKTVSDLGLGSARRRLSLTTRLALLFALVAAVLLLALGMLLSHAVDRHFDELDEHDLTAKLTVIGQLVARTDSETALDSLPQRLRDALAGHDNVGVLLRDHEGVVIFGANLSAFEPAQLTGAAPVAGQGWTREGRRYIGREGAFQLPLAVPLPVHAAVALDISHHEHFLNQVRLSLWLGVTLAAALAALLGWLAARQGLAPLARVTTTARRLSAEQLGERIPAGDAPAEVRELAEAFNGMLDRLEAAFQRLSDYSADIAHELRTPVSNLMTETEVALSRTRSAEAYREVLHSNLEEFERMSRMIGDMLFLAKADEGRLPRVAEPVELAEEAQALLEFYEALAEERGVGLCVVGQARVRGDRLMLRRAVSNLLSNALRHTAPGGVVEIHIEETDQEARLAVCNPGPAIPAERIPRLFERFHRIDDERAGQGEGAGLGLAITRSIVEAHGGHIDAICEGGYTTFTLHLPGMKVMP